MSNRNRTRLLRTLLFVALGGLLVLAWTQRGRFMPVDVGSRAPEYSAATLTGEAFSIGEARGKVIVLNVWATWCKPCLKEMPALERLHQKLGSRLQVVGVSTDVIQEDVAGFVKELGVSFPIIHDPKRRIDELYLVQGLPTTFVIDKNGRIDRKVLGAQEWDDAEHIAYFEKLMAEEAL